MDEAGRSGQELPLGVALSLPATRRALRRYAARSAGFALAGLGAFVAGVLALASPGRPGPSGPVHHLLIAVVSFGLLPLGGGLAGLVNIPRMRRLAARHPWRVWDGRYQVLPLGVGQPALLPAQEGGRVLSVVAWRWNWRVLGAERGPVWYAGDPLHGPALAAPPGGAVLLWARPVRMFGRRMRRLADGLPPSAP
ncbi:hypothetical protein ACIBJF_47775 [Streptomyces sp. NPDC050743]|uniref:hypothetical protein n=1 Tax=Streptomyces sp. NPDC050743 TaxID=3365634 RepID=UPI003790E6AD